MFTSCENFQPLSGKEKKSRTKRVLKIMSAAVWRAPFGDNAGKDIVDCARETRKRVATRVQSIAGNRRPHPAFKLRALGPPPKLHVDHQPTATSEIIHGIEMSLYYKILVLILKKEVRKFFILKGGNIYIYPSIPHKYLSFSVSSYPSRLPLLVSLPVSVPDFHTR